MDFISPICTPTDQNGVYHHTIDVSTNGAIEAMASRLRITDAKD